MGTLSTRLVCAGLAVCCGLLAPAVQAQDVSFVAPLNFAAESRAGFAAVGDFNGDGRLDLAVANRYSNYISVLLGNGDGSFQAARSFGTARQPASVAVGDFNGDGWLDLAVANRDSNDVSILINSNP